MPQPRTTQPDRNPLEKQGNFSLTLFSFGFKHGAPEAELVWDVRFLPNPYWVETLRDRTGLEDAVASHALDNATGEEFLELLKPMLLFLVRQHASGKRDSLRIGIGCTGGRHRSVAVVENLRKWFDSQGIELTVFHRDIEKQ